MWKKQICLAACALVFGATPALGNEGVEWSSADLSTLARWVQDAPNEALPRLSTRELDAAMAADDPEEVDSEANALALRLAQLHLLGATSASQRGGWQIVDTDQQMALEPMLAAAVENDTIDTFFAIMRPSHAEYSGLRAAYRQETDPERRLAIARNMDRWRWMPRSLGEDYVLVNAARFEAHLWRDGNHAGTWRVIVGTRRTPTPVFQATIEGVVLNPWWEIPASIVRESVGALVRNNPSLARARGYVVQNGRYRQRPGPNNALGQMKLVMPNPYSVYMHDTPNRNLFEEEVRSFSHGCIRTGDAIGFATTLLEGVRTREQVDATLDTGRTTTVSLAQPIPVYVTYFTAVSDGMGGAILLDDIYNRDGQIAIELAGSRLGATAWRGPGSARYPQSIPASLDC